jgi:GT2 family glycosyltransferase
MLDNQDSMHPEILAVIVLYRCSIAQSSTCISMQAQTGHDSDGVAVMVYDNSAATTLRDVPANWLYFSDPTNPGLSAAYNQGVSEAKALGARWLLLLDQDSSLPGDFMVNLQRDIALCHENPAIVAIIPIVYSNGQHVSPVRPMLGLDRHYTRTRCAPSIWLSAINSATTVRLSFVESIGGFTAEFWLDYLDHWLFRRIYDAGKLAFVSEIVVEHSLSVANFNQGLDLSRYRNILEAEAAFTNRHLPRYWRTILAFRLVARAAKHSLLTHDKRMAMLMLSAAWRQVFAIFG